MAVKQGDHVTIVTPYETLEAIVLDVRGDEIVAQEKGTKRAEIFPLRYVK